MEVNRNKINRLFTTPRYEKWVEFYLDKRNRLGLHTYRNQTLSACFAYSYDPDNRKEYMIAAQIGCKNINKYKQLASEHYDKHGITAGRIYDLYIKFMIRKNDVNMLYALAKDLDITLPEYKFITK